MRRVDRPLRGGGTLPLAHVRSGPVTPVPLVVVPGGPGMASVLPYARFRATASARGVDVVMVEHRGIGLSRHDDRGRDLEPGDVTVEDVVDDLAAVLDDLGVERAVVLGSSYGTYVAQGFGVRHPQRVAGMVLDSPVLSVAGDLPLVRAFRRERLWDGDDALSRAVRTSAAPARELAVVVPAVYELCGPRVLSRLLAARERGRTRLWRRLADLGAGTRGGLRFVTEPDLVDGIAYGQLGYGLPPDGSPLDPQVALAAPGRPLYRGEPFDLPAELPRFSWPTVVLSGERDLQTPRPVAERLTSLLPDGVLVPIAGIGHSALDTHPLAALFTARAVTAGAAHGLPRLAGWIADLPRRSASRLAGPALSAALALGG
ncbi:alpha/beta hydrolase [Kineococcus rhizosphaerae]|uniref:alpha/beta hydrolase n=1 Tax=Kineococcus rhizosphaerae TaxID=559628 RepID=UPI000D083EDA|nr:alpha/beta hydrolase [Kineococcus rhizosphaerae]